MITIERYTKDKLNSWNNFVDAARNGTFFFNRNYLDYHKHVFQDYSLLIYEDGELIAVLPANEKDETIVSHGGLTFGGLLLRPDIKIKLVQSIFFYILRYLKNMQKEELIYKPVPSFYHSIHTEEDLYAMFLLNAELIRRDTGFVIDNINPLPYQERRIRSIKKAIKSGVEIRKDKSFDAYWNDILIPNLQSRFGINPVHSLEQISFLNKNNPDKICQYNAYLKDTIMAGATLFINKTTVHAQYISATDEGRKNGAIDLLFEYLIKTVFAEYRYFSFGITNENNGKKLNAGLTDWKEGFGARTWAHDFYKIKTSNYFLLQEYE